MIRSDIDGSEALPLPDVPQVVAVKRSLPGKPKAIAQALSEYEHQNRERRDRIDPVLWVFWAPYPDGFYRWRVQLTCNCIIEVLTNGESDLPAEKRWLRVGRRLEQPVGQVWCSHEDDSPSPYRSIVKWVDHREVEFPIDPVEPRHGLPADVWALIRHDEPRTLAFWTVILSCGHDTEVPTSLDWQPADGPCRVDRQRQAEMLEEFDELEANHPGQEEDQVLEHYRRMIADGWPIPVTERSCYTCLHARPIIAYEPIGWLVPRKNQPKSPSPLKSASRASLQRRLRQAEADAAQLRSKIAKIDDQKVADQEELVGRSDGGEINQ